MNKLLLALVFLASPALAGGVNNPALPVTGLPIANIGAKATDATAALPILLYVKNVSILTTGSPADIATITVPAGITRFRAWGATVQTQPFITVVGESLTGSAVSATFAVWDAAGGTGVQLSGTDAAGPSATGIISGGSAGNHKVSTSTTIKIRQTIDSANAGTVSFYLLILPFP